MSNPSRFSDHEIIKGLRSLRERFVDEPFGMVDSKKHFCRVMSNNRASEYVTAVFGYAMSLNLFEPVYVDDRNKFYFKGECP